MFSPYRFEAPWHNFEFAYHVLEVEANLVVLTMAWLTREGAHTFSQLPQEPDLQTLEYWVQRLEPIIRRESEEEIIVVLCNRAGTEGDAVFAGTSTVLGIKNGEVNLYGVLGRGVKELLVVDTEKAPFAKLLRANHGRKAEAGKTDGRDSNRGYAESSPNASRKSTPFPSRRSFYPFRDVGQSRDYDDESIGTPIDDMDDAWEIMSTTASHGSAPSTYSQSGPMPPRNSLPKLELQIPGENEFSLPPWKTKGPISATRASEGKSPAVGDNEIPTPTAPSPTPMSVRPTFNLPDRKPPIPGKKDVIPSSVNMRSGGGAVKVSRADTPITPPLRAGARGKARGPTPISEAPPSPPSDEEGAGSGSSNSKGFPSTSKKSQKSASGHSKSSNDKRRNDNTPRPRASSLSNQTGRTKSSLSNSVAPGFVTAAPKYVSNDAMWEQALRNLEKSDNNITGDSIYDHDYLDDILVGESSSQLEMQTQLPAEVRQQFEHLMRNNERQPSPTPATLPNRPPSTKSRNASLPRLPQVVDPTDLRRMSASRMSIPIVASPSVFRQESQPQSMSRRSESPIYPRPEPQGANNPIRPHHSRQTSETRYERPHSHIGSHRTDSPVAYAPVQNGNSTPSQGASGSGTWMQQGSRPVSRGRQPFSKTNPTNGTGVPGPQWPNGNAGRTTDGVDRGRRVSNNRAAESVSRSGAPSALSSHDRSMSTNSSTSWLFGTPPPTSTQPPLDPGDEIIAMINLIHNDCPVHNSRAPSLEPQAQSQAAQQARGQSRGQGQVQGQVQGQGQGRQASQQRERQPRQRQATPRTQTPNQQQQPQQLLLQQQQQSQTPVTQGGGQEPVYEVILPPHIRELVESLSSPDSRIQSPLRALDLLKADRATPKFDPPTPTAMQFDINDEKNMPASA